MEKKTQGEIQNETCRIFEESLNNEGKLDRKYYELMNKKWVSLESLNKQIRELDPNSNSVGLARLYARLNTK